MQNTALSTADEAGEEFLSQRRIILEAFQRGAGCAARLFYGDRACSPTQSCKEQLIRSLLAKGNPER